MEPGILGMGSKLGWPIRREHNKMKKRLLIPARQTKPHSLTPSMFGLLDYWQQETDTDPERIGCLVCGGSEFLRRYAVIRGNFSAE